MASPLIFVCVSVTILCLISQFIIFVLLRSASKNVIRILEDNTSILQKNTRNPPQIDIPAFPPSLGEGQYVELSRWTGPSREHYATYALNFRGKDDTKSAIPRPLNIEDIVQDADGRRGQAHKSQCTKGGVKIRDDPTEVTAVYSDPQVVHGGAPARERKNQNVIKSNSRLGIGFEHIHGRDDGVENQPSSSKTPPSGHPASSERRKAWENDVVRGDQEGEGKRPSSAKSSYSRKTTRTRKRSKVKGKRREGESFSDKAGDEEEDNDSDDDDDDDDDDNDDNDDEGGGGRPSKNRSSSSKKARRQ
ncbi:MAG: hypothetical protein LQ337_004362 [Flavoplaca oasis]|nr:MAG: hypothetical protein LQ337_004362 [Flavoplaca oasis]